MAKTQTLKFRRMVQAAPEEAFRAVTSSTALREWFSDVAVTEPRKGGRFYAAWNHGYYAAGEYTKVSLGRKVALTWQGRGEPEATVVVIGVAAKKSGSVVTVEHEGVGAGKKWAAAAEALNTLWDRALENLQSVLETGADLRFTLRPMLGVSGLEDVTDEVAARLGVPAGQGLRLDGTVPGMGAEAAGLRKDDVIRSLAGHKVSSYGSLTTALAGRRAGETVAVALYRGGEKLTVDMTLSQRPLPEIPDSALALSEAVRAIYNQQDAALDEALAGATDAEAEFRTAPGEWNVKEVLAHLLHGERGTQQELAGLLTGSRAYYDTYGGNSDAWVQATAEAFPTLASLVEGLKRAEAETVAFLRLLPESFVARKGSFWQVAYSALEGGFHTRDHLAQITAGLGAARAAHAQPAEEKA